MTLKNGHDDPNVTSLDEARRRAAEKVKAAKRAGKQSWTGPNPGRQGLRTPRDWLIGGLFIAMALAVIVWFAMTFVPSAGGV